MAGWIAAAGAIGAVGGMVISGFGVQATEPPGTKVVSAIPPATCVNGAAEVGDTYYPGIGNGGYDVAHYDLNLNVKYPTATTTDLDATATISASATQNLCRFNLDLRGLTVTSVKVNDVDASFTRDGRELIVTPATPITAATGFQVEVAYHGDPGPAPVDEDGFRDGWNRTENGSYTSTPPQGADTWYPNNNTTSDKATFAFNLTVPSDLQAVANGLLVSNTVDQTAGTSTWVWDAPDQMQTYLATVNIGKFTIQRGTTASGVPFVNAIRPDQLDATAQQRLDGIGDIIDFFGSKFGKYPFAAVGAIVDVTNAGYQMEQQTRPEFTSKNGLSALAHELSHQWFGDYVAAHRMRDVWLSEGFATFANWLWVEHNGGNTAQQSFNTQWARASTNSLWANTVHDPGVKNQYQNSTVYTRGGMTLQALRNKIGDDAFFRTLKAYVATFGGGVATTNDFVSIAQRESGQDLRDFFKVWLYTPGKPSDAYCYCIGPTNGTGTVGGDVSATLALAIGDTATFGGFVPGVAKEYEASTTANVISTAADAALTISDPSATAPGHLVNGTFVLPSALQARAGTSAFADVSGSPLLLKSWTTPVANDVVALGFKQPIGANDALRTGSYRKALTLTLSTTNP